jgi:flavin-dependent dehydrogenase
VLLATGAVPTALIAAGMCERQSPSGVAMRGYVRNEAMVDRIDKLQVIWHRNMSSGYGWIFPCKDGVFNVGVCIIGNRNPRRGAMLAKRGLSLHQLMDEFFRIHKPARELMQGGVVVGAMKGAPLRFTLEGARFSRPGLLVIGEAAGSTYCLSGEGIGKAMETGINAAEAIVQGRSHHDDGYVRAVYEASMLALKGRFLLYERANIVNRIPWLTDLVIWRAKKDPGLIRYMTGVLNETYNPGHLLSYRGLKRLFTR